MLAQEFAGELLQQFCRAIEKIESYHKKSGEE